MSAKVSDERLAEMIAYVDLLGPNSMPAVDGDTARSMAREIQSFRENVEVLLSGGDLDVIRCHEGDGPEDLIGSLVLTMTRTRNSRDKATGR